MNPNLIARGFKIADSAARSDIECSCAVVETERTGSRTHRTWYDINQLEEIYPDEEMREIVTYLEQRGILVRKPDSPNIVTFKEPA